MALRLIEMVLQKKDSGEVYKLLEGQKILDHRQIVLADGEVLCDRNISASSTGRCD